MAAAYQPKKSEAGKSFRDVERREHLTFASQLPAVVISSLTSWSPAAAARILHFSVAAVSSQQRSQRAAGRRLGEQHFSVVCF